MYCPLGAFSFDYFNSQPHEEADCVLVVRLAASSYFNSQPHEEADDQGNLQNPQPQHFNSQPHEEADSKDPLPFLYFGISTHSLTKRLTQFNPEDDRQRGISTHSLTKRLTSLFWVISLISCIISTHSLTKRLTRHHLCRYPVDHISTHSLTKRLTVFIKCQARHCKNFNSQPHEEADLISPSAAKYLLSFQLTASRRG